MGIKQFVCPYWEASSEQSTHLRPNRVNYSQMKQILYPLILPLVTLFWSKLRDYKRQNETQSS